MKHALKIGDLLQVGQFFGLITKIRPKTIQYWAKNNPAYPGEYFNENKEMVYDKIDEGKCVLHLGSLKYRRVRKGRCT